MLNRRPIPHQTPTTTLTVLILILTLQQCLISAQPIQYYGGRNASPGTAETYMPTGGSNPQLEPSDTEHSENGAASAGLRWTHLSSTFLQVMCENDGRAIVLGFLIGSVGTWVLYMIGRMLLFGRPWSVGVRDRRRASGQGRSVG